MRPAVFLDRDGTMIRDVGYLSRLDQVQWFPWTLDAIRLLNRAGFVVCVVTNQGGIGLGMLDEPTLHAIHRAMETHLHSGGVTVDGWYFCPHHPRAIVPSLRIACGCRKPQPGMLQAAAREHDLDLARSFVVGDKAIDMAVGAAVGATGVLVRTGYGEGELTQHGGSVPHASYVAADLLAAATWIVDRDATRAPVK